MDGELILGVDGGGTGCRARLTDAGGRVLGEGAAGPANLMIGDGAASFAAVLAAAGGAIASAGLPPHTIDRVRAGLGLAGTTPAARARFFARRPPFAETRVLGDAHAAALGAHGGDGAVVILGTGAVACVARGGTARDIGGWGFPADDLGSGADIGRRAVRAALRSCDETPGGAPLHGGDPGDQQSGGGERGAADHGEGTLARAVLARVGGDPAALVDWSFAARPADYGTLAPLVFDAAGTDPVAEAILVRATAELSRLIALAHRHGAGRVALLGSVAARLAPRLPGAVRASLSPAGGDAMDGAILAVRHGWGARS